MAPDRLSRGALALLAVLIVAGAAALRLYRIDCDPPHGLSTSRAIYTDEGLKYYQARNLALFGQWRVDTPYAVQGHLSESPVPTLLGAAVFKAAGAGRVQARMISVTSGVLTVLLLILIGARSGEPAAGLLAGAFAAVNLIMLSYDRLALFEAPAALFCTAAAFFFIRGGRLGYILVAVFLVLAYFTRAFSAVIAVALVLALVCERAGRSSRTVLRRALIALGCVLVIVLVLVILLRFYPQGQIAALLKSRFTGPYWQRYPLVPGALDLVVRAFSDSLVALWMPLLLVLALLALAPAASRGADCRNGAFVFFWWFVMAFGVVALVDYRPSRYYVLMLPAACYLAAWWIVRLASSAGDAPRGARLALWAGLRIFAGVHIAAAALRVLVDVRHEIPLVLSVDSSSLSALQAVIEREFIGSLAARPPADAVALAQAVREMWLHAANLLILGTAIALLTGAWLFLRRRLFPSGVPERIRLSAAVALALLILALQGARSWSSFGPMERRCQVASAESRILKLVGDRGDAVIAGNWATTLVMDSRFFTLPFARGGGNSWDTFKRFPVTHFLVEMTYADEITYLAETYPQEFRRMRQLEMFDVDFYKIALFEFVRDPSAPVPAWPIGPAPARVDARAAPSAAASPSMEATDGR